MSRFSLTVHFDTIEKRICTEVDRSGTWLREMMESYWKDATDQSGSSLMCGWLVLDVPDWTTRRVKAETGPGLCPTDIFSVHWCVPAVSGGHGPGMIVAVVESDGEVRMLSAPNVTLGDELETYIRQESQALLTLPEHSEFVRKQLAWKAEVADVANRLDGLTIEAAIELLRNRGY